MRHLSWSPKKMADSNRRDPEDTTMQAITRHLNRWHGGDEKALDQVIPFFHEQLRRVAHKCLSGEGKKQDETDDLVSEVYMRLRKYKPVSMKKFTNRSQFIHLA